MTDVMVDIESFGNGKNACIVQVGAIYFDRQTGELGESYAANIDARTAVSSGAELDADTVYWWLSQGADAIKSITAQPLQDIRVVMNQLNGFLCDAKAIWSHATFDFVVLTETYRRLEIKPRFHYRACRDIRTLVDMAGVSTKSFVREGIHHSALDDCKYQITYCVEALKRLSGK